MSKKIVMTKENKQFILKKLIPFIKRAEGNGFAMEVWRESWNIALNYVPAPQTYTQKPACGTVCCIGGSIEFLQNQELKKLKPAEWASYPSHEVLGLTDSQTYKLFYEWTRGWPKPFPALYAAAKTPKVRAEVTIKLLRLIVKTDGQCLPSQRRVR